MRPTINRATVCCLSCAALVFSAWAPAAGAAISQKANVKVLSSTGVGYAKGGGYVKLNAYLSTRDPASTRPLHKPNPVGKVAMAFPVGSIINQAARVPCPLAATANVFSIFNKCNPRSTSVGHVNSVIGEGWALLSNLGSSPISQYHDPIYGAPLDCPLTVLDQYSRLYENAKPSCLPRGYLWGKVFAYLGAMVNGVQKKDRVIFTTTNKTTGVAFAGTVVGNVLTVPLPSGGVGKAPGELALGVVLTDFHLDITAVNYLRAGACPPVKRFTVTTTLTYSKLSGESIPAPAPKVISYLSPCS